MIRRTIIFAAASLAFASIATGLFYNWTMAFGIFWFGASFLILVSVMQSFSKDMSSRLGDP